MGEQPRMLLLLRWKKFPCSSSWKKYFSFNKNRKKCKNLFIYQFLPRGSGTRSKKNSLENKQKRQIKFRNSALSSVFARGAGGISWLIHSQSKSDECENPPPTQERKKILKAYFERRSSHGVFLIRKLFREFQKCFRSVREARAKYQLPLWMMKIPLNDVIPDKLSPLRSGARRSWGEMWLHLFTPKHSIILLAFPLPQDSMSRF